MAAESDFPNLVTGRKAGALTFSAIFALESLVRSLNSTVVSLQAYDLLGSSQKVSELTTLVAMVVLLATLMLPYVLGRLRRRCSLFMWCVSVCLCDSVPSARGGQGVLPGRGAGRRFVAPDLEAATDIPLGESPALLTTKLRDLGQGIFMFVRLQPDAGEAGIDQFTQTLS